MKSVRKDLIARVSGWFENMSGCLWGNERDFEEVFCSQLVTTSRSYILCTRMPLTQQIDRLRYVAPLHQ